MEIQGPSLSHLAHMTQPTSCSEAVQMKRGRILCPRLPCQFVLVPWQCRSTGCTLYKQLQDSSHKCICSSDTVLLWKASFVLAYRYTGHRFCTLCSWSCDRKSSLHIGDQNLSPMKVIIPVVLFTQPKCSPHPNALLPVGEVSRSG